MEKWQGSAGIGLLTSRLHVEGPLAKGKTSVIAGARTTYSDWLLKRLPQESAYAEHPAGLRLLCDRPLLLRRRHDL